MTDKEEKQVIIIVLMIFVLICLLFFGLVAFGYMSVPSGGGNNNNQTSTTTAQNVTGTVFYNDGTTPLPLTNVAADNYVQLFNLTDQIRYSIITDNNGTFISPDVPAGEYYLYAYDGSTIPVASAYITIPTGTTLLQNLTTSRMPVN